MQAQACERCGLFDVVCALSIAEVHGCITYRTGSRMQPNNAHEWLLIIGETFSTTSLQDLPKCNLANTMERLLRGSICSSSFLVGLYSINT